MTLDDLEANGDAAVVIEAMNRHVAEIVERLAAAGTFERVTFQATTLELSLARRELRRRYKGQGVTFTVEFGEGEGPVYERHLAFPADEVSDE